MSHFVREFEALLVEKNLRSGSQVFQIAGLDASMLSRIRAGDPRQPNIQFAEIPRVAAAIGPEEIIYQRLLRARLLDECTDPKAAKIVINISDTDISGRARDGFLGRLPVLPPRTESALRNIIANLSDAGLRKTILWLGNDVFSPSRTLFQQIDDALSSMPAEMNDAPVTPGTEKQFEKFSAGVAGHTSGATTSYRRAKSKGGSGSATGSRPKQGHRAGRKNTGAQAQGRS